MCSANALLVISTLVGDMQITYICQYGSCYIECGIWALPQEWVLGLGQYHISKVNNVPLKV